MNHHIILVNGRNDGRAREAVERALYSGWTILRWGTFTEDGYFIGVLLGEDVEPQYQMGRLQSFGTWGVRLDPEATEVFDVFHRMAS